VALGCAGAVVVLVAAGWLALLWNGADPQPHPDLDDLRATPAAHLVYPGAHQVAQADIQRSCTKIGGVMSSAGCTGPNLNRSYDVTASPHQVVSWYQAALASRGWTQQTGASNGDATTSPGDPRFNLCDYTRQGLHLSLADLCVLPNFPGWDTVGPTEFELQISRG
jgi:hypothetical protein